MTENHETKTTEINVEFVLDPFMKLLSILIRFVLIPFGFVYLFTVFLNIILGTEFSIVEGLSLLVVPAVGLFCLAFIIFSINNAKK